MACCLYSLMLLSLYFQVLLFIFPVLSSVSVLVSLLCHPCSVSVSSQSLALYLFAFGLCPVSCQGHSVYLFIFFV